MKQEGFKLPKLVYKDKLLDHSNIYFGHTISFMYFSQHRGNISKLKTKNVCRDKFMNIVLFPDHFSIGVLAVHFSILNPLTGKCNFKGTQTPN